MIQTWTTLSATAKGFDTLCKDCLRLHDVVTYSHQLPRRIPGKLVENPCVQASAMLVRTLLIQGQPYKYTGCDMFDFEPGYWLIVLAVAICFLTAVVVLASSLILEEDENHPGHPGRIAASPRDDSGAAAS